MKQGVIISTLAGMMMFAACTKDSSLSPIASSSASTTVLANDTKAPVLAAQSSQPLPSAPSSPTFAVVDYQLTTTMSTPQPVQWNSGVVSLATMSFDGYQNANDIMRIPFERLMNIPVKLMGQADLGGIDVKALHYDAADLVLAMAPANQRPALSLAGNMTIDNGANGNVPVQLNINKPVSLVAKWRSQLSLTGGQVYTARITVDLSQLMQGVPLSWLQNAQKSNGTIVISDNSNVDLYNRIVANLQNAIALQLG